jgi:hypothetical protein
MGFLEEMTKRSKYTLSELTEEEKKIKINKYPPYRILWKGMTSDVGGIEGGVRKVDLRFYKWIPNASINCYEHTC